VNDAEELELASPVDLVYVCGTKFLATNSTRSTVHVTYRVDGTAETGGLTLPEGLEDEPGFSETELETKEPGVVELYRDGELVARRLNRGIPCGAPAMASVAGLTSADGGSWSPPFPWPNVAVHLNLLPTGKVLSWGEFKLPQLWDPATEEFTPVPSPINVFCAGHSFLADGRLLVSGGHLGKDRGFRNNTIFTASTGSWSSSTPMRRGRWYPTNITMGNGDVVILTGRDEMGEWVREPEVWTPNGIRFLGGATRTFPYYPRAFLAPDGRVFYAGQQLGTKFLDISGTGRWTHGPQQLYPATRSDGAAVMYEPGKVLYVGGAVTTNTAEIIDLNSAAPAWQWTGSMAFARRHLNATLLPTGEVLVTSGTGGARYNDYLNAVHAAEVWNPSTGTWRPLASNMVNRGYHSTSVLLPDGRVLHAGSGEGGGAPREENAEIFSPPYLFKGPRPVITDAPSSVRYGSWFSIGTPQAADIAKVSLVRLGSTTHSFDMNQRFEWLSFTPKPDGLTISVPSNPNRTPPGHYMLFILDDDGVPSVAKIVKVGSAADPDPPPDTAPSASFSSSCDGFACDFIDASTDDGSVTGWSWDFGDNSGSSSARHPTYTYAAEGSYDVTLTATDNTGKTGEVTKTVTVTPPAPNEPPVAHFTSSCTYLSCAFTDGSTDDDGTVAEWSWDFGDGGTSTARNPSHTYAAAGSYTVTLIVTDDDDATNEGSAAVTVTAPPSIALTVTGRIEDTRHIMTLRWTGATGTTVDVYRNGPFLTNTANDGVFGNSRTAQGPATYTYKVCQAGTTICSNEATVQVGGETPPPPPPPPPPSSIALTVTGRTEDTRHIMTLRWTGATGTTVDVYRNGPYLTTTANDGVFGNSRTAQGPATYTYKVCQAESSICSNEATVVVE
jgi:PKD repeat protein